MKTAADSDNTDWGRDGIEDVLTEESEDADETAKDPADAVEVEVDVGGNTGRALGWWTGD